MIKLDGVLQWSITDPVSVSRAQNQRALQDSMQRNRNRRWNDKCLRESNPISNRFKVDSRKYPSEKGCTVAITGALEEVVELGWLHAQMHRAQRRRRKGIKDWIRNNAEAAND